MIDEATQVTIGLELASDSSGQVPFDVFATVVSQYNTLIKQVQEAIDNAPPFEWRLAKLQLGSAEFAVEPKIQDANTMPRALRAVSAMDVIGETFADGDLDAIPYNGAIRATCRRMADAIRDRVPELKLINGTHTHLVRHTAIGAASSTRTTYGTIRGTVEAINSHQRPHFTLYEDIHGRPIRCMLTGDFKEYDLKKVWEKRVVVRGFLTTQEPSGRRTLRDIESIEEIEPVKVDFSATRGIWKLPLSDDEILEAQRRLRRGE